MEDWLKSLPWKDWSGALIGAAGTLLGVILTIGSKGISEHRSQNAAREKEARERKDNSEITTTQELTERFKALMDGYEARIVDVTGELTALRGELREARQKLESHQRVCLGCPNFDQRMKEFDARSVS